MMTMMRWRIKMKCLGGLKASRYRDPTVSSLDAPSLLLSPFGLNARGGRREEEQNRLAEKTTTTTTTTLFRNQSIPHVTDILTAPPAPPATAKLRKYPYLLAFGLDVHFTAHSFFFALPCLCLCLLPYLIALSTTTTTTTTSSAFLSFLYPTRPTYLLTRLEKNTQTVAVCKYENIDDDDEEELDFVWWKN